MTSLDSIGSPDPQDYVKGEKSPKVQTEPVPALEPPALVTRLWDLLAWHLPGIIALGGTIILLYLNFKQYAIGGELGKDFVQTANILGALQLAVKAHELAIIASLFAIGSQWILRSLRDNGLLFGLLGAESTSSQLIFIASDELWAALRYGISGILPRKYSQPGAEREGSPGRESAREKERKRDMFLLALFLSVACIISSLAGPASGVLMIPRVGWFKTEELSTKDREVVYPNIIIQYLPTSGSWSSITSGLQYWTYIASHRDRLEFEMDGTPVEDTTHKILDISGWSYINVSTTDNRPLDGNWTGSTKARTVLRREVHESLPQLSTDDFRKELKEWTGIKQVQEMKATEVEVVCRERVKQPCSDTLLNSSDWCYRSVNKNELTGTLSSSRNLLLIHNRGVDSTYGLADAIFPAVWITEGPKEPNNPKFSSSIELIIDTIESVYPPDNRAIIPQTPPEITVCSVIATMKSAIATSFGLSSSAEQVDYLDYLTHTNGTKVAPHTLLYYEKWLDSIHVEFPIHDYLNKIIYRNLSSSEFMFNGSLTFPPRNQSKPSENPVLTVLADAVRVAVMKSANDGSIDAHHIEEIAAGSFAYLFSRLLRFSGSQYTIFGSTILELTGESLPEPLQSYESTKLYGIIKVYIQGYGFRLSSRTSMFGAAILLMHALIFVSGSIWILCWKREVVQAWGTIQDYTALGMRSSDNTGTFEDSPAGVSKRAITTTVKVEWTVPRRLEIVAEPQVSQNVDGTGNV